MGINGLNIWLRKNTKSGIGEINISDLNGKTIVIDISIYLYRFKSENNLIDGLYEMLLLLLSHNIKPIVIFDGKPPDEKKEVLKNRQNTRIEAEEEYNKLLEKIKLGDQNISDLNNKIKKLKRQIVKINRNDIHAVKKMLNLMGITYYQSEGESDIVCANLVITGQAFACMSEDMDMFVYGCNRVLRYISLNKKTIILYDLSLILKSLNISFKHFQIICIMSGTDYNKCNFVYTFDSSIRIYINYIQNRCNYDYLSWLFVKNYIDNKETIEKIINMFNSNNISINKKYLYESIENLGGLKLFLKDHGFIFA
tara:strand:- start:4836 stop:5768 length:933 start_codon:yes stop_codon:yes gene_type:complete